MIEELIVQETFKDPTVDRVEYGKDWVKGYKDGEVVVTSGNDGIPIDPTKIRLKDINGNVVTPVPAPLDEITKLQLAFAELLEVLL